MMKMQRTYRRSLRPALLAGLPFTVGLILLSGCGDSSKPSESNAATAEAGAAKPAPAPAKKAPPKTSAAAGKQKFEPDMSSRERRALRKSGKLKE